MSTYKLYMEKQNYQKNLTDFFGANYTVKRKSPILTFTTVGNANLIKMLTPEHFRTTSNYITPTKTRLPKIRSPSGFRVPDMWNDSRIIVHGDKIRFKSPIAAFAPEKFKTKPN